MPGFSDYIVFVDESGDHGMTRINEAYPLFVLACCLISKKDYMEVVVPAIHRIKSATFGHDCAVLHERDIRRDIGPFPLLRDRARKHAFLEALADALAATPMTIFAAVIDQRQLLDRKRGENPYEMSLRFCLERIYYKLNSIGLQLADLVARPIGMSQLRSGQTNRAREVIQQKLDKNAQGRFQGYGLKCFP